MNQITSKPRVRRPEISIQYDHDLSWGVSGTLREHWTSFSAVKGVVRLSDLRSLSNVVPITFLEMYTWGRKGEMVMVAIEKMEPNGRKKHKRGVGEGRAE